VAYRLQYSFSMRYWSLFLAIVSLWLSIPAEARTPTNKLLQMYRLFYLPFSIEFKQGKGMNDIFPLIADESGKFNQLLKPEHLRVLEEEFTATRKPWEKNSLFINSPVEPNKTQRITQRLISHKLTLKSTAWDKVSVSDQIKAKSLLEGKPELVKKAVTQYQFLRSFLGEFDEEKFNFFVIGPSWCESSKEYRYILEQYAKSFPDNRWILHSVVIDDPNEKIFESQILQDLFPFPENYSHDNVPRFIALQKENGQLKVWEEGDALVELQQRFLDKHRGFLNKSVSVFNKIRAQNKFLASGGL